MSSDRKKSADFNKMRGISSFSKAHPLRMSLDHSKIKRALTKKSTVKNNKKESILHIQNNQENKKHSCAIDPSKYFMPQKNLEREEDGLKFYLNGIIHNVNVENQDLIESKDFNNSQEISNDIHKSIELLRKSGELLRKSIKNNNYTLIPLSPNITISPEKSIQSSPQFLKRDENKCSIINKDSPREIRKTKIVYDSLSEEEDILNSQTHKEKIIYDYSSLFLFNPKGNFIKTWNLIIYLSVIYCVIFSPYKIAFSSSIYTYYDNLNYAFFTELSVDTFFFLDTIFHFFLPFQDELENFIFIHSKIIANYLTGWFFIDCFGSFPISYLNLIIFYFNIDDMQISRIYVILKWLKVTRVLKLILNNYYHQNKLYRFLFSDDNNNSRTLFKALLSFLSVIHITSCIWCYLGNTGIQNNQSWIISAQLEEMENFEIYLTGVYFSMMTVYTVGYGDILPKSRGELLFTLFFMIIGVLLFSFCISWLGTMFGKIDKKTIHFKKQLKILDQIASKYELTPATFFKIKKTIKLQYKRHNADKFKLINTLPTYLKNEIIFKIHQQKESKMKFFKNTTYDFIIFIVPLIKQIQYQKNEVLFSLGEYVEEMYLVRKGCLSLNLGHIYYRIEVARIWENCHFGEILMYSNEQSHFDLKVKSKHSEIFLIKKSDFSKLKMKFPEIILDKLTNAYSTYRKILERRKHLIEIISNCGSHDREEIKKTIKLYQKNELRKIHQYEKGEWDQNKTFNFSRSRDKSIDFNPNDTIIYENTQSTKITKNALQEQVTIKTNNEDTESNPLNINIFSIENNINAHFMMLDTKKALNINHDTNMKSLIQKHKSIKNAKLSKNPLKKIKTLSPPQKKERSNQYLAPTKHVSSYLVSSYDKKHPYFSPIKSHKSSTKIKKSVNSFSLKKDSFKLGDESITEKEDLILSQMDKLKVLETLLNKQFHQ
jgi:hypothetical protein